MKKALAITLGVVLVLCGIGGVLAVKFWNGIVLNTAGKIDFVHRMAVPPLAASTVDAQGRRVFDLTAAPGSHNFGDRPVPTWGFNGAYLGPTLRATRGEEVVVNVRNSLAEMTTVHWHGMHLPARMDGGPHQMVKPGQPGPPPGKSPNRRQPFGITRIPTAKQPTTCIAALPDCSSSTIPPPTWRPCRTPTASTTSRSSCRTRTSTETS